MKMRQSKIDIPAAAEVMISVFKSVTEQKAYDFTLQQFIDMTAGRVPNRYAAAIEVLRSLAHDDKAYHDIKRGLCAFTTSCRCRTGGSRTDHPEGNNGTLCIDIDGKENAHLTNWAKVRDALGMLPYAYISALSAGGRGVFVIIAVDPDLPHEKSFAAVEYYFKSKLGITIDKSCKDVARLRFASYDPQSVIKHPTEIFRPTFMPSPTKRREPTKTAGDDYDRIRAAARVWIRRGIPLTDYADWVKCGAALSSLPDGLQIFDDISSTAPNYKGIADVERKFNEGSKLQKIGAGSFIHLCHQYGITNDDINAELSHTIPSATEPRGAGESPAEAAEHNAEILRQGREAYAFMLSAFPTLMNDPHFTPPTARQIEILDPTRPAEAAPF